MRLQKLFLPACLLLAAGCEEIAVKVASIMGETGATDVEDTGDDWDDGDEDEDGDEFYGNE